MRRAVEFDVQRSSGPGEPARVRLLRRGEPLGAELDGARLEAAFEVGANYVLLLTDDCPYEEVLHIHLIDPDGRSIDRLHLGVPYSPGLLGAVQSAAADSLRFEFPEQDATYELTVRTRPWRRHQLQLRSAPRHEES